MYRLAPVVVMACLLTACTGTVTLPPIERGTEPVIDASTHGVVLSSSMMAGYYKGDLPIFPGTGVGSEYFRCYGYSLLYQKIGDDAKKFVGDLSGIPSMSRNRKPEDPFDYEVPDGVGYLQATVVPAGDYEVWFRNIVCGTVTYYAHDFRVPFTVAAGKANYLGEVRYLHRFDKSPLGSARFAGAMILVGDEFERDMPLFAERYPFLADYDVVRPSIDWTLLYETVE